MIYWDLSELTIFSIAGCRVDVWELHLGEIIIFLNQVQILSLHFCSYGTSHWIRYVKACQSEENFQIEHWWIEYCTKIWPLVLVALFSELFIYTWYLLWQQLLWYIAHCHSQGGLYIGQDYPFLKTMKSHYLECRFLAVTLQGWSLTEVLRLSH